MMQLIATTVVAAFAGSVPAAPSGEMHPQLCAYAAPVAALQLVTLASGDEADAEQPPTDGNVPSSLRAFSYGMASGRVVIGLASIVAVGPTLDLLGFPDAHDNPSARLMGRLFGVRDIGLGVVVFAAAHDRNLLRKAFLLNAGTDLLDAIVISIPLVRGDGIDTAAGRSLAFALTGLALWIGGWIWATYWAR